MTVHVHPLGDLIVHELQGSGCPCGPKVEWIDPDTGQAHDEPLVTHHSLDGRELHEPDHTHPNGWKTER